MTGAILLGPMVAFAQKDDVAEEKKQYDVVITVLGLAVVLTMIDGLANGVYNFAFILIPGSLISYITASK